MEYLKPLLCVWILASPRIYLQRPPNKLSLTPPAPTNGHLQCLTSASRWHAWCVHSWLCGSPAKDQGAWREDRDALERNTFVSQHGLAALDDVRVRLHPPVSRRLRQRFLDKTVDLWTKAANTMALPWPLTSCSSWHRMQVTSWRRLAPPTRLGPTHTWETQDGSELGGLGKVGKKEVGRTFID